ncbi:MAG: hypothetical protein CL920_10650 [Deltaproteobacteria bacterium]|nr:hypothetical protein [Deltaproteobacteria bacterium]MBU49145.1 hypothetical protein [Deltaproteobacteria bacterium]
MYICILPNAKELKAFNLGVYMTRTRISSAQKTHPSLKKAYRPGGVTSSTFPDCEFSSSNFKANTDKEIQMLIIH